jgi:prevent-host-death family protein
MSDSERAPQIVDAAEAREAFGALLDKVVTGRRRVVVRENGRDVAALVSAVDLEWLKARDRQREDGLKLIEELHARFAHLDPEEVERDILEEVEAMRAEERAKRSAATSAPRT